MLKCCFHLVNFIVNYWYIKCLWLCKKIKNASWEKTIIKINIENCIFYSLNDPVDINNTKNENMKIKKKGSKHHIECNAYYHVKCLLIMFLVKNKYIKNHGEISMLHYHLIRK